MNLILISTENLFLDSFVRDIIACQFFHCCAASAGQQDNYSHVEFHIFYCTLMPFVCVPGYSSKVFRIWCLCIFKMCLYIKTLLEVGGAGRALIWLSSCLVLLHIPTIFIYWFCPRFNTSSPFLSTQCTLLFDWAGFFVLLRHQCIIKGHTGSQSLVTGNLCIYRTVNKVKEQISHFLT